MRAIINGKLVNVPAGTSVKELKQQVDSISDFDDIIEEGFGGTKPLSDNEIIQENSKLHSIPKIVKG